MLRALRRSRLLALLLAAASPAAGGTLLPAIHPCPVDAPWLAAGAHAHHASHGMAHHGGDAAPKSGSSHLHDLCSCPGSCVAASAVAPPATGAITFVAALLPATRLWVSEDASLQLAPRSRLLPPAIAPPPA